MWLLEYFPIQSLILFSIAPILGALQGYHKANELKTSGQARENEGFLRVSKGIGIGLLIDLLLLCFVLVFFTAL